MDTKKMRIQELMVFLAVIVGVLPISLPAYHEGTLPTGQVTLQADTGKYLSRCNYCGPAKYPDSAGINQVNGKWHTAIWTIEKVGDKIALKADSGNYLARCHQCWKYAGFLDSAFVNVKTTQGHPEALWTAEQLTNGKWAFKADSGKYLARCTDCNRANMKTSNFAFVQIKSPQNNPWAQWTVAPAQKS